MNNLPPVQRLLDVLSAGQFVLDDFSGRDMP
jgi:hypothetical protein